MKTAPLIASLLLLASTGRTWGQSEATPGEASLASATTQRYEIGVIVNIQGGSCSGVVATMPIPMDWPEQKVTVVHRDVSASVSRVSFRTLQGGVKQMVVTIPRLSSGQTARAVLTFEVVKNPIPKPENAEGFTLPQRIPSDLLKYLRPSPSIESNHAKIRSLAEQIVVGKNSEWEKVESIYDWVRENITYRFDVNLKGALTALEEGHGDCEELTSLFIAFCRVNKIPARAVWVPGHCYPEFYLRDDGDVGHWLPCQAAGSRQLGFISESRPILQKGDSFRLPGQRKAVRYVAPTLKAKNATANPQVEWVLRLAADQ